MPYENVIEVGLKLENTHVRELTLIFTGEGNF